jgi:hypothetical protein
MPSHIDTNNVRKIIAMVVEGWTGKALDDNENQALDEFMEKEVRPLDRLELLGRMGTPADTLTWFLTYLQNQTYDRCCNPLPASDDEFVCYAP